MLFIPIPLLLFLTSCVAFARVDAHSGLQSRSTTQKCTLVASGADDSLQIERVFSVSTILQYLRVATTPYRHPGMQQRFSTRRPKLTHWNEAQHNWTSLNSYPIIGHLHSQTGCESASFSYADVTPNEFFFS